MSNAGSDCPAATTRPNCRGGVILLLVALALAGCASKTVYLLADGRAPASDPALNRKFEQDRIDCNEERSKAVQFGDHRDGSMTRGGEINDVGDQCLAEKGYVAVPQDQMAAKQRELAAAAGAPAHN